MEINQDNVLLTQLRNNERSAYIALYDLYYPELARYILQNSGSREDAEDNFQETLLVLINKLKKTDFVLTSALNTYLYAINRNLWLKKLRIRGQHIKAEEYHEVLYEEDFLYLQEKKESDEQRSGLLKGLLENITSHCVILITRIFFNNQDPEELIKELGYKNAHTFHNQKYKCINLLRKAGKNN